MSSPFQFPASVTVTPPQMPSLVMAPPTPGVAVVLPVAGAPGEQGPQGDVGPQGPQGVPGDAGTRLAYGVTVTNQTLVQINHGLAFNPAGIVCLDSANPANAVEYAAVSYPMVGIAELTFGFPFTGQIFLS